MKWLFIVLLIVNVIYFGRELDRQTDIELRGNRSALSIPASANKLLLIDEMEHPPGLRETDSSGNAIDLHEDINMEMTTTDELVSELPDILLADPVNIATANVCFRFGPFPDENQVKGLYDWFLSRNSQAQIRYTGEQRSTQMYWIYLAPQQSRENAMAVLQEMKRRGVDDYRLISRGDLENAISLGLFSSREAVNERLQVLKEKGYVPVVVPYANVNKIYWLDVRLPVPSVAMDEFHDGYPAWYESVPINCADISIGTFNP